MAPSHAWWAASAALLLSLPAAARAARPVIAIYPLPVQSEDEAQQDAQALLTSALASAAQQEPAIVPANPPVLPPSCGPAAQAMPDCLARLAGCALVLWPTARSTNGRIVVTVRAVNAQGKVFGPAKVALDPYFQSAEPLTRAILHLHAQSLSEPSAPAAPVGQPAQAATPPEVATPESKPEAGAESPATPVPDQAVPTQSMTAEAPKAASWRRPVGIAGTFGGLAILGAAAITLGVNMGAASALQDKYDRYELTLNDRPSFERVRTFNVATVVLAVAGGLITAGGITLWALSPDVAPQPGGVRFGVSGKF